MDKNAEELVAEREQKILENKNQEKFYIQKVDDPNYLNHTIGPGKSRPYHENKLNNGEKWRKILLFEFLGCNFR